MGSATNRPRCAGAAAGALRDHEHATFASRSIRGLDLLLDPRVEQGLGKATQAPEFYARRCLAIRDQSLQVTASTAQSTRGFVGVK